MNTGLYAAFVGMRARQQALDAIANNIANASTPGFRADRVLYRSAEAQYAPQGGGAPQSGPQDAAVSPDAGLRARAIAVETDGATDYSAGPIRQTGRQLDVALEGDGFLVVQTALGQRYTRAGALTLNASGQLVTQRGDFVVGEGGPITVPPGEVTVGEDGTVSAGGRELDRLKLVRFADPQAALRKEGESMFVATGAGGPLEAPGTRIVQGALEGSNVNPVAEMVAMMQCGREFDTLQRSITLTMNDLGRKVSAELGRI